MKREIKFRAYCKRSKQMHENDYLVEAGRQLVIFAQRMRPNLPDMKNAKGGLMLFTDDENMEFMQFTGLKDANGIEIFEGDIVRYTLITKDKFEIIPCVVYFEMGAFYIKDTRLRGRFDLLSEVEADDIAVVGNIYENPEFLEKAQ